jgi:hypothetical protein
LRKFSGLLSKSGENILIYKPSLVLIDQEEIRLTLESFLMKKRTIREQGESLRQNFELNLTLNDEDISRYIGNYQDGQAILVSAGPSLTKQLPLLKIALEKGVKIACVGTSLLTMIKAGIRPNFVMVSDPKDAIQEQFVGVENENIPLFYLSTANHGAVKRYKGPRIIVWQRGFEEAEIQAKLNRVPLVETGGSVATCLLDLLIKLGFKKIALVGQDLAFTDNQTHAMNTHRYNQIHNDLHLIEVEDYYRTEKIKTSRNLFIYLKWFERYVEQHGNIELWNCTEGGAYIDGWKHFPLKKFLSPFSFNSEVLNIEERTKVEREKLN